jgi:hypothetical protein
MAADLGVPRTQVKAIRWHAKDSFRKSWLKGAAAAEDVAA